MKSESLMATEAECALGRTAPRVSLTDIEKNIYMVGYARGSNIMFPGDTAEEVAYEATKSLTVCIMVLRNGFTIIGKSAPASPANFDAELGRKLAYEDAVRQVWPLMGYALRQSLHEARDQMQCDQGAGADCAAATSSLTAGSVGEEQWQRRNARAEALRIACERLKHANPDDIMAEADKFAAFLMG